MKRQSADQERARVRALLRYLEKHRKRLSPLLILTHDYPDPDAIATAYGLKYLAETFGISARIAYRGIIGRMDNRAMVDVLRIRMYKLRPTDFRRYANIALVDTQPDFGNNPFPPGKKATLVIDQHGTINRPNADFVMHDTACGATCVLIAQAILSTKKKIPQGVATAIAYGIITDTLDLFRAKKQSTITTYLKILHFSNMRDLAQIQNPVHQRRFFTTLQRAMEGARFGSGLVVSHLGSIKSPELVSQAADFLLACKDFRWCFVTGRFGRKLYLSLRSKPSKRDAGVVLRSIVRSPKDAGGHGSIAGGSVFLNRTNSGPKRGGIEQNLTKALKKQLRIKVSHNFVHPFGERN
jgi:nanoRNase/pAp phosphatase (c-di-AMP/oligoRNAs hydrolase)